MSQPELLKALEYLSIATSFFLVCRLWGLSLHNSYRWFFAFLLIDVAGGIWGLFQVSEPIQMFRYIAGQSVRTVLAAAVVLEIYRLALVDRKAIARAGRKFVVGALLVGLAISAAQVYWQGSARGKMNPWLQKEILLELAIGATVLLLLAVIAGFLAWFPIQLRKNLVIYILGFVGFFATQWGTRMALFNGSGPREWRTINVFSFVLTQICLLTWIFALTRSGETKIATTAPLWSPERAGQLQRRLDEINRDLERFVR